MKTDFFGQVFLAVFETGRQNRIQRQETGPLTDFQAGQKSVRDAVFCL